MKVRTVALAFLGGAVAGAIVWSIQIHRSRRDLFSRRPLRRWAALGYLSGHPGVDTARILSDYVAWEQHPRLKARGERLLRRMQHQLG